MVRRPLLPVLAALFGALLGGPLVRTARAEDVVVLKSGTRLGGRILSEGPGGVVLERASGGGRTTMTIPADQVSSVERGPPDPTPAAEPGRPVRDEWFLLRSDQRTIGTRHLLLVKGHASAADGWRFEEELAFVGDARMPGVRTQRIEETTADLAPTTFHWRERGESGGGFRGEPYEVIRTGPVKDGVWESTTRDATASTQASIALPRMARGPLALREALVRASPRSSGLVEMPMVDAARGEVRTVRAGFTSTDVAVATGREAVLRVEDQDRVLESRWGIGDPPRCLREDVAPGVVAVPCTKEQAEAVGRPAPVAPTRSPLDPLPQAPPPPKHFTLPEYGFDLTLPGASWVAEAVACLPDETGPHKVASISSRLLAADVRVEWDPAGGGGTVEAAEDALLARLRRVSKDVAIVGARRPVLSLPGAYRFTLLGTVRKERLRTEVLLIDRGGARLTLLAACPESAWEDTRSALESLLASFRWL